MKLGNGAWTVINGHTLAVLLDAFIGHFIIFWFASRDSNSTKCVKGTAVLLKYSNLIDSEDQIKKIL